MKGLWQCYRVLFAAVLVCGFFPGNSLAGDDVLALVGGIPVTKYEVQREAERVLPMSGSFHGGVSEERKAQVWDEALESLIERAYHVRYALAEEIAVENAEVEKIFQDVLSRFVSVEDFEKALRGERIDAYRATIYRALVAKKAREMAVDSKANVADSEVEEYYQKNLSMYLRPKQFRVSHILVKVDPTLGQKEREVLKKRAEELKIRAESGEEFYNLAYYNSDDRTKFVGGDIGYIHMGQTVKEFENALLNMKPGEISGPVETISGFHVIKLVEVNEARQLTFDEVKEKIRKYLEEKRSEALYKEWIAGLKAKYKVQRFDP